MGVCPLELCERRPVHERDFYVLGYLGELVGGGSHSEDDFQLGNKGGLVPVNETVDGGHLPSRSMMLED